MSKKTTWMWAGLLLFAMTFGAQAGEPEAQPGAQPEEPGFGIKVLHYLGSRALDFADIFSLSLGFGAQGSLEATATDFCRAGFAYGDSWEVVKGLNRQYGVGAYEARNASLLSFTYDCDRYRPFCGTLPEFDMYDDVFWLIDPHAEIYTKKISDLWAVGVRAGIILNVSVMFHPVEFADFLVGIVGCDLADDDL